MHRTLLLPQPGSALVQKSLVQLLTQPTRDRHYSYGDVEGPSLATFTRDRPSLTVHEYRQANRQALGLSELHFMAVSRSVHEILQVYPSGYYNMGIQPLPLWDALFGTIRILAQPIFVVHATNWRSSRSALERTFRTELNTIGYPDKDAALEKLMLASNYSRAEYRLSHRRMHHLTDFGYWYRPLGGTGRRFDESIRSVHA